MFYRGCSKSKIYLFPWKLQQTQKAQYHYLWDQILLQIEPVIFMRIDIQINKTNLFPLFVFFFPLKLPSPWLNIFHICDSDEFKCNSYKF